MSLVRITGVKIVCFFLLQFSVASNVESLSLFYLFFISRFVCTADNASISKRLFIRNKHL